MYSFIDNKKLTKIAINEDLPAFWPPFSAPSAARQ
jgi:hypothetical protein